MRGGPVQVEWAERIQVQVDKEFERVARAFRSVAEHQVGAKRADIEAVIGILESLRNEVMSQEEAGYFIRDWQEISDQVR